MWQYIRLMFWYTVVAVLELASGIYTAVMRTE